MTYPPSYVIEKYLEDAKYRPNDWYPRVGVFFMRHYSKSFREARQTGQRSDRIVTAESLRGSLSFGFGRLQKWGQDWVGIDLLEREPDSLPVWRLPERLKEEDLVHGNSVAIYLGKLIPSHEVLKELDALGMP